MKCLQLGTAISVSCPRRMTDSAGIKGPGHPVVMGSWAPPAWQADEKAHTAG